MSHLNTVFDEKTKDVFFNVFNHKQRQAEKKLNEVREKLGLK